MKVLFLDIDGVLNCEATSFAVMWPLDRYMAFMVGKIALDTDCKIVLSSSWRHHPEAKGEIERVLATPIIDKTPDLPHNRLRGHEIQAWLDDHKEVTRYAILDDDSDMLESQLPNFFQTSFKTGLTPEIAKAITDHLNAATPETTA